MRSSLLSVLVCLLISLSGQAQNSSPYWSLAGNSNASASSKLGTTNSVPLRLYTNNLERLRIDAAGRVGIGTTNLEGKLTLFNNGSTPAPPWVTLGSPIFVGYSETTGGNGDFFLSMASDIRTSRPNFIARRARGTLAAPLAVENNDFISSLQASGYDGSAFQNPANIDFFVDGTPASGHVPVRISFTTGSNLANRVERLKIGSTGNITFNTNQLYLDNTTGNTGIGTATPAYKLHVEGTVYGNSSYAGGEGVKGQGNKIGVVGVAADTGTGVYGYGRFGISGNNNSFGGSGLWGVARGMWSYGVLAESYRLYGIYATTYNSDSYAGHFGGDVSTTGGYYTGSDRKLKQNITGLSSAMDIINKLQPKAYEFRQDGNYKHLKLPKGKHYGLIAQELEEVLPGLVKENQFNTTHPVPKEENLNAIQANTGTQPALEMIESKGEVIDYKTVNYIELIPILVKGMQEQQQQIEALITKNKALEDRMQSMVATMSNSRSQSDLMVTVSSAYLEQSTPNPTGSAALIRYNVPQNSGTAQLLLTNMKGQVLRQLTLNSNGVGQLTLNVAGLPAGTYTYSLWVDSVQTDSKKLVIAR
jgi:hypothetical protein